MILYYFPIAQNTINKTVSENFYRGVYACICMCTYLTIFLFTGLITVYTKDYTRLSMYRMTNHALTMTYIRSERQRES